MGVCEFVYVCTGVCVRASQVVQMLICVVCVNGVCACIKYTSVLRVRIQGGVFVRVYVIDVHAYYVCVCMCLCVCVSMCLRAYVFVCDCLRACLTVCLSFSR